jgi:ribosomal protein S18 acetylase RimI-like enzyme
MEHVRRAEAADAATVGSLLTRAGEEQAEARGARLLARLGDATTDEIAEPAGIDASWMGERDDRNVLCGEFDGVVVGVAAGQVLQSQGGALGRVLGCYVEPDARCVGVGSALLEGLMAFFTEHRCGDVDATALPGDRATKQLLEAAGFKARLVVLHRSLR